MGIKKEIFQLFLIYILFLFIGYIIYKPAFSSYFFQDDWFTFKISQASNIKEFLQFFIPRTDVIYYRPLGMQVYFFIMRTLFGINPLFFRISALILYSFNGFLVYLILLKLKFTKEISFLGATLYCASVTTYIPFFWSATFPFILGPTFFLLSLIFYLQSTNKLSKKIISIFFYLCGLLSLEILVVLPLILIFYEFFYKNRKNIKLSLIYFILLLPIIYLRLFIFPAPLVGTYTPRLNLLGTLRTYLFWSFNWPEEIARQMVGVFKINQDFIRDFGRFINVWFVNSFIIIFSLVILPVIYKIAKLIKTGKLTIDKISIFGLFWFAISLSPLLMFSDHSFPYYLPVPLIGLIIFMVSQTNYLFKNVVINQQIRLLFISLIIIIWIFSSLTTIKFNQLVYWAPKRAKLSKELITAISKKIKEETKVILISNPEYKLPLNDQDAVEVLFGKKILTIYSSNPNIDLSKFSADQIIIL